MDKFNVLVIINLIFLFSCNNNKTAEITNKISSDSIVSFTKDLQPLFDEDCSKCHDYLKNGISYKMLTTQKSSCKVTPNYIDTINPKSSYLYLKLHQNPVNGTIMKGEHWTPENINKLLLWIEQGAKNN